MACSAGNFIHGSAVRSHFRLSVIPWVKRSMALNCYPEGRDFCSLSPVNYIPKKLVKNEENWDGTDGVRRLNVPRRDSCSSFGDNESKSHNAFRSSDISSELNSDEREQINRKFIHENEEFFEGSEETDDDNAQSPRGIQSSCNKQNVEKSAIELLASRAFTAVELRKKLQGKRFPLEIIDAVITDFKGRGFINDSLYAETYSQSKWSSSSWGPRRIRQALFKKGVSAVDAKKAVEQLFEGDGGCGSQDSVVGMSKVSIDQLYTRALKQWQQSRGVPQETRKSRIIRWLQYRGFNWGVIKCVLKKLESERH